MNIDNTIRLVFVAAFLYGVTLSIESQADEDPNIVFIFIDDMGYGDIGPFGNRVNQTPNLDRMATEGNILRQFYVSNTACTPSRSALMTGFSNSQAASGLFVANSDFVRSKF
jgi:hypothetical protein